MKKTGHSRSAVIVTRTENPAPPAGRGLGMGIGNGNVSDANILSAESKTSPKGGSERIKRTRP